MQRQEWITFLSGILQEDIGRLPGTMPLVELIYWDSMAQLVVMAKLHETGIAATPKQIRNLQTLNELIQFIS